MIILDDEPPRKQQLSGRGNDEPLPHTALLEDAMNTELELSDQNSPQQAGPSREVPAPLPPSYEASIQVEQDRINRWKRKGRRRILIPTIIVLNLVVLLSILLPKKFKRNHFPPFRPPSHHDPQWLSMLNDVRPNQFPMIRPKNETEDIGSECKIWKNSRASMASNDTHLATFTFKPKQNLIFRPSLVKKGYRRHVHAAGSINIVFDKSANETAYVLDVKSKFINTGSSNKVQICVDRTAKSVSFDYKVMERNSGFVPIVLLDLTLHLPTSGELRTHNFTSFLPHFEHIFADSSGRRIFDNLHIHSHSAAVESMGIMARSVNIHSGIKGIRGRFDVREAIHLKSDLSPIDVQIGLDSCGEKPVTFRLETVNSPINAKVILSDVYNERNGTSIPKFTGNITTANGLLDLSVLFNGKLDLFELSLNASTSLKPAYLSMDHRYEGNFSVNAKSSSVEFRDPEPGGFQDHIRVRNTVFDHQSNSSCDGWTGFSVRNKVYEWSTLSRVELSNELATSLFSFTSSSPDALIESRSSSLAPNV